MTGVRWLEKSVKRNSAQVLVVLSPKERTRRQRFLQGEGSVMNISLLLYNGGPTLT